MARSTRWAWCAFGLAALTIALPIVGFLFSSASYARYWYWVPYVCLAVTVAAIAVAVVSTFRQKPTSGLASALIIGAALACLIAPFLIFAVNGHGEIRILRALNAVNTGSWEQASSDRSGNFLCFDTCTSITLTFATAESVDQAKATLNHGLQWRQTDIDSGTCIGCSTWSSHQGDASIEIRNWATAPNSCSYPLNGELQVVVRAR